MVCVVMVGGLCLIAMRTEAASTHFKSAEEWRLWKSKHNKHHDSYQVGLAR